MVTSIIETLKKIFSIAGSGTSLKSFVVVFLLGVLLGGFFSYRNGFQAGWKLSRKDCVASGGQIEEGKRRRRWFQRLLAPIPELEEPIEAIEQFPSIIEHEQFDGKPEVIESPNEVLNQYTGPKPCENSY